LAGRFQKLTAASVSSHNDHSLSGENVKTLPNVQYDPKGAAGFDLGEVDLNIAQVPINALVEPPHKHPNHRGVDGGSQATGHNSGVVSAGSSGVDTSNMPADGPSECFISRSHHTDSHPQLYFSFTETGMQGWFIVALVLGFFTMLGCGLWCQWLERAGVSSTGGVQANSGVYTPHDTKSHTAPVANNMKQVGGSESML
jgi:hypothetical protein